jgi:hypothetical protein
MYYLVYILAAFGIFALLVLFIKLFAWALNCDIKPIGESEIYTMCSNSIINANEAIDEIDKMLEEVIIEI